MVFIVGLYAAPVLAEEQRWTLAEPIAVAVEPKDDVAAPTKANAAVPAAESKATPQSEPASSQRGAKGAPKFEDGEGRLALEIEPFGWHIRLFGR